MSNQFLQHNIQYENHNKLHSLSLTVELSPHYSWYTQGRRKQVNITRFSVFKNSLFKLELLPVEVRIISYFVTNVCVSHALF